MTTTVTPLRVAVLGQGYVGLPLSMKAVAAGHDVVGIDASTERVKRLAAGDSFVEDVPGVALDAALRAGRYRVTDDALACEGFDVAVATDGMEALKRLFSPEFRNRLDAIFQFAPLDMPVIERVVDKLLLEIEAQLEKKGVSIVLDDASRDFLMEKGFDPQYGARPMRRAVEKYLEDPLAEEILRGTLLEGEKIANRKSAGYDDTDEPGFYRVAAARAGGPLVPRPQAAFAVNVDPAESDLRPLGAKKIAALKGGGGKPGAQKTSKRRVELWHSLGAALLILLLGETLLGSRR